MKLQKYLSLTLILCASTISGCASVASSSVPYAAESEQFVGEVSIVEGAVPAEVGYEVIGNVKANARTGYRGAASLYPLLAEEARKVGANAIIDVSGGRTISFFSYAAPFTGGTAIKIDDLDKLTEFGGVKY